GGNGCGDPKRLLISRNPSRQGMVGTLQKLLEWIGRTVLQVGFSCCTGWRWSRKNVVGIGILHSAPCDFGYERHLRSAPFRMTGGNGCGAPKRLLISRNPSRQGMVGTDTRLHSKNQFVGERGVARAEARLILKQLRG